jgi:hypothetical protein
MDCCGVARRLDWAPHLTHHYFNPKLNKFTLSKLQGFSFLLLDGWIRNGAGEIHVKLKDRLKPDYYFFLPCT